MLASLVLQRSVTFTIAMASQSQRKANQLSPVCLDQMIVFVPAAPFIEVVR